MSNTLNLPPDYSEKESTDNSKILKEFFNINFEMPERLQNEDTGLVSDMRNFLIDTGYIKSVASWDNSWGFAYVSDKKCIEFPTIPISENNYNYYIFRLGFFPDGSSFFPGKDEVDTYRFNHEVGHAFQSYLMDKEAGGYVNWINSKIITNTLETPFSRLFRFCYKKRSEYSRYSEDGLTSVKLGLTTWGNESYDEMWDPENSYDINVLHQNVYGVAEDSNDLVNMALWHPEYINMYLKYLSLEIPGYGRSSVENDKLVPLSVEEARELSNLIKGYISKVKNIIYRRK